MDFDHALMVFIKVPSIVIYMHDTSLVTVVFILAVLSEVVATVHGCLSWACCTYH